MYIILTTKELYVIKNITLQDYKNLIKQEDKIDEFFEEFIEDKNPECLSLRFSEFYSTD